MTQFLVDNPLLLLFLVVAVGYPLGKISVRGISLGLASVLFAGLAIGAIDQNLKIPEIVYQLGLVLFVYTIGLANGRTFFASFRRDGVRNGLLTAGIVVIAVLLTIAEHIVLEIKPTLAAGMFAGSLTNTPALAGELEYLKEYRSSPDGETMLADPVVGYSVAYPIGVLGFIVAMVVAQRAWNIDYRQEARRVRDVAAAPRALENRTVRVTQPAATSRPVEDLIQRYKWPVVFGRLRRRGNTEIVTGDTHFREGDLVSVVGVPEDLDRVVAFLGALSDEHIELDRSQLDFRRIFVSDPAVVGRQLSDLGLPALFGAVVTRIRRGDVEFLPQADTVLEPGDRIRVVAPRGTMPAVTQFFGDSYRALSEIDVLTFSLGLALGLLVGAVPFPLPGGADLKLGLAGGPLIVALILGALDRTGPFVWSVPYSANLTLRQFGLVLFLASVGTRAGYAFVTTLRSGDGVVLLCAGALITFSVAATVLWIGYRLLHVPMGLLLGMAAGIQTQPAALGFALEQTGDELPNLGYAAIFPLATIAKILAAQVLLTMLL